MDGIRLVVDPLHFLAFGSVGGAYMGIGSIFEESARMVLVNNQTDASLFFSYDGVEDHFTMPEYSSLLLTITQNDEEEEVFALPALSRLYVKELGTPTEGLVYVTQFRGNNDA